MFLNADYGTIDSLFKVYKTYVYLLHHSTYLDRLVSMSDDLRDRFRRDYRSISVPSRGRPKHTPTPNNSVDDIRPASATPLSGVPTPLVSKPVESPLPVKQPQLQSPTTTSMPSRPVQRASEPVSVQNQAKAQSAKKPRQKRSKMRTIRKVLLIVILLIFLGSIGAGSAYAYQHVRPAELPISYVKNSKFVIYYPFNLPDGYYVDKDSYTTQDNALVFTIKNSKDPKKFVPVSEQALPPNFNPDRQLPDASGSDTGQRGTFTTTAGKGEIGSFQGNQVASLVAGKTWIIMNVSAIPSSEVGGIASSFQRVSTLPVLSRKQWYYIKNS